MKLSYLLTSVLSAALVSGAQYDLFTSTDCSGTAEKHSFSYGDAPACNPFGAGKNSIKFLAGSSAYCSGEYLFSSSNLAFGPHDRLMFRYYENLHVASIGRILQLADSLSSCDK